LLCRLLIFTPADAALCCGALYAALIYAVAMPPPRHMPPPFRQDAAATLRHAKII